MSNVIDRRAMLGGLALFAAAPACAPTLRSPGTAAGSAAPPGAAGPAAGAEGAAVGAGSAAPGAATGHPPLAPLAPLPPLDDAVFARRHDRLRALARDAGASLVFVTSGTTAFAYLAGGRVERSERLIAMVVPVDG